LNALRPRIKELNIEDPVVEEKATGGSVFKRASHTRHATVTATPVERAFGGTTVNSPASSPIRVPIAGYTGHRMGYRSQNFYGKNYRDCSIQSKILQNMASHQ